MNTKVEVNTIDPQELLGAVAAGRRAAFQMLFNLEESGHFLKSEIEGARAADFIAFEASEHTLKLSYWNHGETESERRSLSIDVTVLKETAHIPQSWTTTVDASAKRGQ